MNNLNSKAQLIQQLKQQKLSVGILSANWLALSDALATLEQHQIKVLHFDVADGQFCPMFTVGAGAVKSFPTSFFKDVHLMVKDQLNVAKSAVANGANLVTLQVEQIDVNDTLDWLAEQTNPFQDSLYPVLAGLSICPNTPIEQLYPYVNKVDVFQLLTLDPRTGEKFPPEWIKQRIDQLCHVLLVQKKDKLINVDGSMTLALAQDFSTQSDIDWIVSGSALFAKDLTQCLNEWKQGGIY